MRTGSMWYSYLKMLDEVVRSFILRLAKYHEMRGEDVYKRYPKMGKYMFSPPDSCEVRVCIRLKTIFFRKVCYTMVQND